MYLRRIAVAATASLLGITAAMAQESTPTIEEMWQIIQQQQAQIEALQAEVEKAREENAQAEQRLEMTESQIEATGEFVEQMAEVQSEPSRTSIGGYGELHYNNYLSSDIDDEIDFHRFVLYFGHESTTAFDCFQNSNWSTHCPATENRAKWNSSRPISISKSMIT